MRRKRRQPIHYTCESLPVLLISCNTAAYHWYTAGYCNHFHYIHDLSVGSERLVIKRTLTWTKHMQTLSNPLHNKMISCSCLNGKKTCSKWVSVLCGNLTRTNPFKTKRVDIKKTKSPYEQMYKWKWSMPGNISLHVVVT